MTNKIKELAEQAGFSFKYKTVPDELNPGHKLQDLEKFAELIVRECLDQCYNRGMNDALYEGQLKAAAYIEEHFGVKND